MAKKTKTVDEEVTADAVEITLAVKESSAPIAIAPAVYVKPKLSSAQIKELLKEYSKVTLKARGII